jgi:hypothetical protein
MMFATNFALTPWISFARLGGLCASALSFLLLFSSATPFASATAFGYVSPVVANSARS